MSTLFSSSRHLSQHSCRLVISLGAISIRWPKSTSQPPSHTQAKDLYTSAVFFPNISLIPFDSHTIPKAMPSGDSTHPYCLPKLNHLSFLQIHTFSLIFLLIQQKCHDPHFQLSTPIYLSSQIQCMFSPDQGPCSHLLNSTSCRLPLPFPMPSP